MENADEPLEAVFVAQHFPLLLRVLQNAERMRMFAFLWEREFFAERKDVHSLSHWASEVISKTVDVSCFGAVVRAMRHIPQSKARVKQLRRVAKECLILKRLIYWLKDKPYDIFSSTDEDEYYSVIRRARKTAKALSNEVASLILEWKG